MEIMDRFRKVFRKFYGKSFNKNSKKDMQAMMALSYLLAQDGVNLSGRLYFHFKPDENGFITSPKLMEYIKENGFGSTAVLFYERELKTMSNLYNAVKDLDNKQEVLTTLAKIKHFQSKRGHVRLKDLKQAYQETYKNEPCFEDAFKIYAGLLDVKNIPTGKLITKKENEGMSL